MPVGEIEVGSVAVGARWYVLWTRSHCESLVQQQLVARGFRPFNPRLSRWSRRGEQRHLVQAPMFPGYLFLHHALDKESDVEVRKTRGLVTILGDSWEQRAVVPDAEIDAIRRLVQSGETAVPYPYLKEGQRVRITRGPMSDVEGILVRHNFRKGLLVLSVDLLHKSVAVEIDCTWVTAA